MKVLFLELGYSAGTETVVVQVVRALRDRVDGIVLAAPRHRQAHYASRGLDATVAFAPLEWSGRGWRRFMRFSAGRAARHRLAWLEQMCANLLIADIIQQHQITHVFLPCIFNVPMRTISRPVGAMAMDLAWHHFPEGFPGRSTQMLDAQFESWLERADIVFPVSDATSDELKKKFPRHASKYASVPHGSQARPLPLATTPAIPLFFTPASITANKNHLTLLKAARRLFAAGYNFRVVLSGRDTDLLNSPKVQSRAAIETLRLYLLEHQDVFLGRIETRGFISDAELEEFYAHALRVVLPTAYEGFGLPLLEAFERGAPVICSPIPPFREQIARYAMADLAEVVDPMNEENLAAAMEKALASPRPERLSAVEHTARLNRWTWDNAAEAYCRHFKALPSA